MKKHHIYKISVVIVILDQLFKFLVRTNMNVLESHFLIPHFFSLTYVQNEGAAWGMFRDATIFLIFISVVAFFCLLSFIRDEKQWNLPKIISFGFILGGLLGNLIDRIFYHYVIDYLDFRILGYHFPVFNFADITIVVGVFIIAIEIIRSEVHEYRSRKK